MAETSRFWDGTITGDAVIAPYDAATEFAGVQRSLAGGGGVPTNVSGVFKELNNLYVAVAGGVSPASVATGRAIVDGTWYQSDTAVNVAIPTPGAATRIDRIVLRKDFAAQTVRVTRIAGVEGGGTPALVQVAGVTWDAPLAVASITTGGVVTVTNDAWILMLATVVPLCIVGYSSSNVIAPIDPVPWDTDFSDFYSMHDPVTNNSRVTVPIDGVYKLSLVGAALVDPVTVANRIATAAFYKNGLRTGADLLGQFQTIGYISGQRQPALDFTTIAKLRANDYIQLVYGNQEAGARIGAGVGTSSLIGLGISVKWIGAHP